MEQLNEQLRDEVISTMLQMDVNELLDWFIEEYNTDPEIFKMALIGEWKEFINMNLRNGHSQKCNEEMQRTLDLLNKE